MEAVDVFKLTVYRREADIGHLVDVLELLHGVLPDAGGGDLPIQRILDLNLDIIHRLLEGFDGHRAFGRRATGRLAACCGRTLPGTCPS